MLYDSALGLQLDFILEVVDGHFQDQASDALFDTTARVYYLDMHTRHDIYVPIEAQATAMFWRQGTHS